MRLQPTPVAPVSPADRLADDITTLYIGVAIALVAALLAAAVVARVRRRRSVEHLTDLAGGVDLSGDVSLGSQALWDPTPVAPVHKPTSERRHRTVSPGPVAMTPPAPYTPPPAPGRPPIAERPTPGETSAPLPPSYSPPAAAAGIEAEPMEFTNNPVPDAGAFRFE